MTYSLALGPFHPAWRGPQRFDFKLNGERIADIEYQDGFNERGCAERLPRLDLPQALHLVTRICGTCSFAHSLAFCQALEQLPSAASRRVRRDSAKSRRDAINRSRRHRFQKIVAGRKVVREMRLSHPRPVGHPDLRQISKTRLGKDGERGVQDPLADADRLPALVLVVVRDAGATSAVLFGSHTNYLVRLPKPSQGCKAMMGIRPIGTAAS